MTNLFSIKMKLKTNLVRRLRLCEVTKMVNINHRLVDTIENTKLSTNHYTLSSTEWNYWMQESYLKGYDECYVGKFWIALEHVIWSDSHRQLYLEYSAPQEVGQKPYELFKGRSHTHNFLRTWRCLAKVTILFLRRR